MSAEAEKPGGGVSRLHCRWLIAGVVHSGPPLLFPQTICPKRSDLHPIRPLPLSTDKNMKVLFPVSPLPLHGGRSRLFQRDNHKLLTGSDMWLAAGSKLKLKKKSEQKH